MTSERDLRRMPDDPAYDIEVSRPDDAGEDPLDSHIQRAVRLALGRHDCVSASIDVSIVDDARIADLNKQYLGHAGPTDVLSFDLSEDAGDTLAGQIVVSSQTARRQASCRAHSTEAEIVLYCIHGTLHLLGYDDRQPADARRMHQMEDTLLTELGWGPVYAARTE